MLELSQMNMKWFTELLCSKWRKLSRGHHPLWNGFCWALSSQMALDSSSTTPHSFRSQQWDHCKELLVKFITQVGWGVRGRGGQNSWKNHKNEFVSKWSFVKMKAKAVLAKFSIITSFLQCPSTDSPELQIRVIFINGVKLLIFHWTWEEGSKEHKVKTPDASLLQEKPYILNCRQL